MRSARAGLGFLLAAAVACGGGGGGGGGGAPTHWTDQHGNQLFIPELGEKDVATLTYAGDPSRLDTLVYSATDPDLVFGGTTLPPTVVAGRISTGALDTYCDGTIVPTLFGRPGLDLAPFKLDGDNLVFIQGSSGSFERVVCSKTAVVSRAPIGPPNLSTPIVVDDGVWMLGVGQMAHLKLDGTADMVPFPSLPATGVDILGDQRAGLYTFESADKKISTYDVRTGTTKVVAEGLNGVGTFDVQKAGLVVTQGDSTSQVWLFSRGTTPVMAVQAGANNMPQPIQIEYDGAGIIVGGSRYDSATGMQTQLQLLNINTGDAMNKVGPILLPSGHVYFFTGDFKATGADTERDVALGVHTTSWSAPITSLDETGAPDYSLDLFPKLPEMVAEGASIKAYPDGTCLVTLAGVGIDLATSGVVGHKMPGQTVPAWSVGAGVVATACGSKAGKVVSLGFAGGFGLRVTSSDLDPLADVPLFGASHVRWRDKPCEACADHDKETLGSAWTVKGDGTTTPVFSLVERPFFRPFSLKNFVVLKDGKLVVVTVD
jgi:hypothetical protein